MVFNYFHSLIPINQIGQSKPIAGKALEKGIRKDHRIEPIPNYIA